MTRAPPCTKAICLLVYNNLVVDMSVTSIHRLRYSDHNVLCDREIDDRSGTANYIGRRQNMARHAHSQSLKHTHGDDGHGDDRRRRFVLRPKIVFCHRF